jgi:peptidoglycan/xylan/chitin deacetylase (PgdA/CDA1 family)
MSREVDYCANHPDVAATESCARCGRKICYNCQTRMFGKIYCGPAHFFLSLPKTLLSGFRGFAKAAGKGGVRIYRKMRKMPRHGWIEAVLALWLVFSLVQILKLRKEVGRLGPGKAEKPFAEIPADTTGISSSKKFIPLKGGMVSTNRIDISGRAEENRMVSLLADGRLLRVLLPEGGQFEFKGIPLHRGQNKVEVRAITPDGDVSILEILTFTYGAPMLAALSADFSRGALDRREIALTFDGGSVNNAAEEILNILKEKGVKSTFFLTGEFIRNYPETTKRIVAEGHDVGNHTWSHPHLTSFAKNRRHETLPDVTAERLNAELTKTASLFRKVTGKDMVPLWRAPYGEINPEIIRWAAEAGFRHVGWTTGQGWEENMDTLDWVADKSSNVYHSADQIAAKILSSAKRPPQGINGAVILMHLGTERKDDFPHRKLPDILDGLKKDGYRAVRVSDMLPERL